MAVARADEVAHVQIGDLMLGRSPRRDGSSVLIHGKRRQAASLPTMGTNSYNARRVGKWP